MENRIGRWILVIARRALVLGSRLMGCIFGTIDMRPLDIDSLHKFALGRLMLVLSLGTRRHALRKSSDITTCTL